MVETVLVVKLMCELWQVAAEGVIYCLPNIWWLVVA